MRPTAARELRRHELRDTLTVPYYIEVRGSLFGFPRSRLGPPKYSRVELTTLHGGYDWSLQASAGT